MKKITLSMIAILFAVSVVMAADKTPIKKTKAKAATTKALKKGHCIKGSPECTKKGC